MSILLKVLVACMFFVLSVCAQEPGGGGIEIGDEAPDFSLTGSDGKVYTLSQFKGSQPVVIAWFPKAFTGG